MISYNELEEEVKNILSEKRYIHSQGVVTRALEYARNHGEDEEIVKLVAIAHDIAKEIPKDERLSYAESINCKLDDIEKRNLSLVHAKVGAKICQDKFGFTEDMVNAVKYHTTGRENMTKLEKIIYLADATEPNRTYGDLDYYVDLCKKDLDRAMYEVAKWSIGYLVENDSLIHLDTIRCFNYYKK